MIQDKDVVFVTTTLGTKWLEKQKELIKKYFPESDHIIVDGSSNWPYCWFYWLEKVKSSNSKWFVLLDEDCFLTGRKPLEELLQKMEDEDISLSAVSDGYHHYRGANSVAINSFFMAGNRQDFLDLNFNVNEVEFWPHGNGWKNSKDIYYDESKHGQDFYYPHRIMENGSDRSYEQEPYYILLWMLKERGKKFYYLYPHFDERFKSTNPRIIEESDDIVIHMWYTRFFESPMMVHGTPNHIRYVAIENYLKE